MTDTLTLSADFCPHCGAPVASAEAFRTNDEPQSQGVFEREGAHLAIEGDEIRVYEHDGGEA